MVQLIIGKRGTGKTKKLIEMVNHQGDASIGNVVCIEKGKGLSSLIDNSVRLVDIDEYTITGPNEYYGFISGLLSGNYDITHIFTDATSRIVCGENCHDMDMLEEFILRVETLGKVHDCTVVFTMSADLQELPDSLKPFVVS